MTREKWFWVYGAAVAIIFAVCVTMLFIERPKPATEGYGFTLTRDHRYAVTTKGDHTVIFLPTKTGISLRKGGEGYVCEVQGFPKFMAEPSTIYVLDPGNIRIIPWSQAEYDRMMKGGD